MRKFLLLSAAAAMAAVLPSLADAQNQGRGKGKGATVPSMSTLGKQLVSPGSAGQLFQVGQQLPAGFNNFTALSALPGPVRSLLPSGMNYIQQGSSIAVVDPASRIVRQVIPIPR